MDRSVPSVLPFLLYTVPVQKVFEKRVARSDFVL